MVLCSLTRSHHTLQSPDTNEQSQRNLYLTAAVLIRESFITLDDLMYVTSALLGGHHFIWSCSCLR